MNQYINDYPAVAILADAARSMNQRPETVRMFEEITDLRAELSALKARRCDGCAHIKSTHFNDDDGNPAGGCTTGVGIEIAWQNGPLGRDGDRVEPNGAFVEGVIQAAIDRLEYYNASRFRCRENSLAITKLEEALHWLNHRTANREARKVEGTHQE